MALIGKLLADIEVYTQDEVDALIPDVSVKADKTNVLQLNNTTAFTPDADYEPATKKYVDDIDLSGLVPYTGATGAVNLGANELSAAKILTPEIKTDTTTATDLKITTGADKTMELQTSVWDDMRVVPGSFDRPGTSDPTITSVQPGGSGTATFLYRFEKNNIASFTIQLPHAYKVGTDIYAHVHWTSGANGDEEGEVTVGWKLDYTWANINGNFGTMATLDLSDACDGVDWKHQMTPNVAITGTDKGISSMLICNIKRTDTGADDTWVGTGASSPFLLEIDFHFEIDTFGSRQRAAK